MSEHAIQCWSCGTRKTLDEISSADGYCPDCSVEIDLAEYYPKLATDYAALEAECERLNKELSACTESPGGCGYWREAAKRREQERDALRAELEAIKGDAERYYWLRDHYHGFEHYRAMKHRPNALRDEIDAERSKLSSSTAA